MICRQAEKSRTRATIALGLLALVGCTSDDSTPMDGGVPDSGADAEAGLPGDAEAGVVTPLDRVTLSGASCTISAAATWRRALYIADCDVHVTAALTIEAGSVVKFGMGHGMLVDGSGSVNATGTAAAPVAFTSIKDDIGGDSNGDGTATAPAAADWQGIELRVSGSTFAYAWFTYAGAENAAALDVSNDRTAASVTHSVFAHNRVANEVIHAPPALDAREAASGTTITNNTFFDNTIPLGVSTRISVDDTNSFDNAQAAPTAPQPSKYNAIIVRGCGQVTSNITWSATKVPFVIGDPNTACNYLTIPGGGHLTLATGVVVKFFPNGNIGVDGILTANASATGKITFTSIKDDTSGGDTNGDAASTTPAGGDWHGITLDTAGSTFEGVSFLYGGGGDTSMLEARNEQTSVVVRRSVFAHARPMTSNLTSAPALDVSKAASATVITGNAFYDNTVPLSIGASFSLDDSNTFDSGVPSALQPNLFNAIIIRGCDRVESNITWAATKAALVVGDPVTACNYMTIAGGGNLILGTNVTMKFFNQGRIMVDEGAGLNSSAAGVSFTSIKDDTRAGDTNGDMASTTPAATDWQGIFLDNTCTPRAGMFYFTCPT